VLWNRKILLRMWIRENVTENMLWNEERRIMNVEIFLLRIRIVIKGTVTENMLWNGKILRMNVDVRGYWTIITENRL